MYVILAADVCCRDHLFIMLVLLGTDSSNRISRFRFLCALDLNFTSHFLEILLHVEPTCLPTMLISYSSSDILVL